MLTSISLTPATPPPYRSDEPILSVLYRDYKDFTFRQTDFNILVSLCYFLTEWHRGGLNTVSVMAYGPKYYLQLTWRE